MSGYVIRCTSCEHIFDWADPDSQEGSDLIGYGCCNECGGEDCLEVAGGDFEGE